MKKSTILVLIFTTTIFIQCGGSVPEPYYRNLLGRTLGDKSFTKNLYRWICDYVTPDTVFPSGIVIAPAPTGTDDTYERFVTMVRCHERARRHFKLNELCERDPQKWRRVAARELRRCVHAPLSPEARREKGSFVSRVNQKSCEARFGAVRDGRVRQAVLLCLCDQVQFPTKFPEIPPVVSLGSARFSITGASAGSSKEQVVLQRCIEETLPGATNTCGSSSAEFNVLSRHLMEACCKRARAELPGRKFECKALVPDDLSLLGI